MKNLRIKLAISCYFAAVIGATILMLTSVAKEDIKAAIAGMGIIILSATLMQDAFDYR